MLTTEQLDGLRMMSVDPIDYVVSPKALALALVMPLLTGIFIVFSLAGAYVVAVGMRELDGGTFTSSLQGAVVFSSDIVGCIGKAILFGMLTGLIATFRGYTSEPTAAGVSASTTGTVVTASVAILIADFFQNSLWGI
jgi:phospholipid/cholesterol/gamma-HCH transport system permease protein